MINPRAPAALEQLQKLIPTLEPEVLIAYALERELQHHTLLECKNMYLKLEHSVWLERFQEPKRGRLKRFFTATVQLDEDDYPVWLERIPRSTYIENPIWLEPYQVYAAIPQGLELRRELTLEDGTLLRELLPRLT